MDKTPRQKYLQRWTMLKNERSSWMSHWKDISDVLMPRSGRFFIQDRNKGQKRHNAIYDNTGSRSLKILQAGMMSGMTSPARPWFRLATEDRDLMKYGPVKVWLNECTETMRRIFAKSNTYRALHSIYGELGAFGTAASIVVPDYNSVIRHTVLTAGEYAVATNWKGEVVTPYREFQKQVGQLVAEFGYKNCSLTVQSLYQNGSLDQWITVVHLIEPRTDRDIRMVDAKNMAWQSVYFELLGNHDHVLRESGFKRFPGLCPRWEVTGGDIYGSSPGQECLGDLRQLQHEQLRKAQGIDYKIKPPLQVPSSLKNKDIERLPDGITYVDQTGPHNSVRTLYDVQIDLRELREDIMDVRERIRASFYADLFLMLANSSNPNMTATEVAERHEEKLLMLGPVLERLQNELLDPQIEITFDQMMLSGIVPPPPAELEGHDINVELVGILAQAQRAIGVNSVDRFVSHIGNLAALKQDQSVWDNYDSDKDIAIYGDMLGVSPELLAPDEKRDAIRDARAKQIAEQQKAAAANQAADTAQKMASAKTNEPNALTDATALFSGYTQ